MGYYSFSKTFQKFQLKDNKFHVLFHTKFLDVDYLVLEIYLHLFKHGKTSDSLKMTGVLACFNGFFYPNLVNSGFDRVYFGEKVSKCSCFVLIFTYNCGLPISFILNLYVSYLLFRFEFAVDVIPKFFGIMFTLFRHIILLMLDHFTGFLSHYISDPFILHQDIWIMCFHEPSPQPCLSFNHVSHIFVKRSFPTIFFKFGNS